jgi:uncharacterized membrane protein
MDASAPRAPVAVPAADKPRVWVLRAPCALGPRELAVGCLLPCVFGMAAALAFALAGFPLVVVFVLVEMLAVGAAFVAYARHAADQDTLTLKAGALEVEQRCGAQVQHARFDPAWVRVQRGDEAPARIRLSSGGKTVQVGRRLAPGACAQVERELRAALRTMRP